MVSAAKPRSSSSPTPVHLEVLHTDTVRNEGWGEGKETGWKDKRGNSVLRRWHKVFVRNTSDLLYCPVVKLLCVYCEKVMWFRPDFTPTAPSLKYVSMRDTIRNKNDNTNFTYMTHMHNILTLRKKIQTCFSWLLYETNLRKYDYMNIYVQTLKRLKKKKKH